MFLKALVDLIPILFLVLGSALLFLYFRKRSSLLIFSSLIVLFLGSILVYSVLIAPFILKTHRVSLNFPLLPEKLSYRIAFFSDLHCGPLKGERWLKKVVDKVNKEKPDLVLIGGDFVLKAQKSSLMALLEPLKDLKAREGVFAVLGNHDYGIPGEDLSSPLKEVLESLSVTLLQNINLELENFNLVGVDEVWERKFDLKKAFSTVNPQKPVIGLCHNPDLFLSSFSQEEERSFKADLWLLGHTHNGQLRLPFLGPLFESTATGMEWGFYQTPLGKAFITQGVGESGARVRLFTFPEVLIIDLKN